MKKYFKSRKYLYKQMKMLAEVSKRQIPNDGIAQYSAEMLAIAKELKNPLTTILFGVLLFDFSIHLFIFIKKLFGCKR